MELDYAVRYRELYERHWWWRSRERLVEEELRRVAPAGGFGPILDIGCGDGLFFPRLRAFGEPEGLEPDPAIVTASGQARGQIHVQPFDDDFDPGRRYGLVLMLDVLEHLDDDAAALRQVHDLLVPGGILLLTVPAFRCLWTRHDDLNHHRTRYTRSSLGRAFAESGLALDARRYFFHWLVPLKLAVRAKEALVAGEPAPPSVPPEPSNRLFAGLSRLEQRTWGRLPWPVGSSLMALAHRPSNRRP